MVVGGFGKVKTESCQLDEGDFKCQDHSELDSYISCPTFVVPVNYTDSCWSFYKRDNKLKTDLFEVRTKDTLQWLLELCILQYNDRTGHILVGDLTERSLFALL